jgi:hypothetical protein
MAPSPLASERASVGLRANRRRQALSLALAAAGTLAACRQTVVLDPTTDAAVPTGAAGVNGAAGGGGGHASVDAGGDGGGTGQAGMNGGNHVDGGRTDALAFCFGGQIQPLSFMMHTPDVVFSVDRSNAMTSFFGTGSRLQVIQGQVDALVAKYQKVVRFGYEEFPAASMGMSMCGNGQGCCAGAVVPPTLNALKWIDNALMACGSAGAGGSGGNGSGGMSGGNGPTCASPAQRPTADALTKCDKTFSALSTFPDSGSRYVVLLTGGDPSCMSSDPMSTPCGDAVTAVTKLNRDSIGTAVFGVGDEAVGSTCLDQLALAGGLDSGGASPLYHLERTPTDLDAALAALIETMAEEACQIDVRQPPADPTKVALLFDGVAVPQDGVDGWDFDAGSTVKITIHGASCDTLLQKAPKVDLVSGCTPPHH